MRYYLKNTCLHCGKKSVQLFYKGHEQASATDYDGVRYCYCKRCKMLRKQVTNVCLYITRKAFLKAFTTMIHKQVTHKSGYIKDIEETKQEFDKNLHLCTCKKCGLSGLYLENDMNCFQCGGNQFYVGKQGLYKKEEILPNFPYEKTVGSNMYFDENFRSLLPYNKSKDIEDEREEESKKRVYKKN